MLTLLLAILMLAVTVIPVSAGDVSVGGYFKRDGTYVQPHMRSAPDSSYNNNWSTYPNVNPYTGQQGTRPPKALDGNGGIGSGNNSNSWGLGSQPPKTRSGW
jgi:hypothetical protein